MQINKLPTLLATVFCTHICMANQAVMSFIDKNPNGYVLSADGKICHGPLSEKRPELIKDSNVTKKYKNLEDCLDPGGNDASLSIQELISREKTQEQNTKFYGINWGLALAFTYMDTPRINDISDITISDDQTIYVNHQSKHRAMAMLESHYFFKTNWLFKETEFGHGPFLAIGMVGEDGIDPLSTYGLGYMWGFKRNVKDNPTNTSWNIGFGYFVDTNTKQLRPEFIDGSITEITDVNRLIYSRDESGPMLIFSATF